MLEHRQQCHRGASGDSGARDGQLLQLFHGEGKGLRFGGFVDINLW